MNLKPIMSKLSYSISYLKYKIKLIGKIFYYSIVIIIKEIFHKQKFKDLIGNLIFKLGLVITGVPLSDRFRFNTKHCEITQHNVLMNILKYNKDTEFGKKYNFMNIKTVSDYRSTIPIHSYDDLSEYIERHTKGETNILIKDSPISYATTSGTTGTPKYIPITRRAQQESHKNVARIFIYSIFREVPDTFNGGLLTITSPAEEGTTPDGTTFGSTSGQLMQGMNPIIKRKYIIPYEVFSIQSYEAKYYTIILLGMMGNVTFLSTANPSTLSLIAKKGDLWKERLLNDIKNGTLDALLEIPSNVRSIIEDRITANPTLSDTLRLLATTDPEKKLRPKHYFSNLKLISCWTGGNSSIFINEMKEWYGDIIIRDLGYLASEIRGTIPMKSDGSWGALTINENFFEFVKDDEIDELNPSYYGAHELKLNQRYYLFFTSKAGLYRYNINDIIEVKAFLNDTPQIVFYQKGKGVTNITGEKLYEQQIMNAVSRAEKITNIKVTFYMTVANVNEAKYDLYTEFENFGLTPDQKLIFIQQVEENLNKINIEYEAKRKSLRLKPIELKIIEKNSFETFKQMRIDSGIREAQFKTVPLTIDADLTKCFTVNETITLQ